MMPTTRKIQPWRSHGHQAAEKTPRGEPAPMSGAIPDRSGAADSTTSIGSEQALTGTG